MNVVFSNIAREPSAEETEPLAAIAAALFPSMGVDGVYARTQLYEEVIDRLSSLISRQREPATEVLRFPPVMSRHQLEKSGYLESFPNLLGYVCALHGSEADIRSAADRFAAGDAVPLRSPQPICFSPPPPAIPSTRSCKAAVRFRLAG
jgi:hypothetical protein